MMDAICDSFALGRRGTKEMGGDSLKLILLKMRPETFQEGRMMGVKAHRLHGLTPQAFSC